MPLTRPSDDFGNKSNVNPVQNRPTEATAEDFNEAADLLNEYADAIEALQVETSPNPYYGRFQTLAQLSLAYPTGELNAFAIIDAGAGVTPQVAAWDDVEEIWEISGAVDTVVQAASLSAFPVTGNSNTLYVALDTFKPYIWYNSSYWSLVPDAQATFNVFLVRDVASSIPDVSTNGLIYIKTDGSTGLTHILFPVNYSSYLNDLKTLVDGGRSMYLKIYNHTKRGFHLIAVDSLDFADVDDTCHLVDIATGLTTSQIEPEDTVQVFIDTDNEGSTSNYLGTYTSLANLQSAHPTASPGNYADVDAGVGTDVQRYIWDNTDDEWVLQAGNIETPSIEFQTEITATTTVFDGSQKGDGNIYPFNSISNQTVQIDNGDYVENDVINIERRGAGTLQIVQGTDVRFRGVRDENNEFFVNDSNSMVSLICRGNDGTNDEFSIIGNLKRGYSGAVTTTSYAPSLEPAETKDITVTGTGFSDNMLVSLTGNATLNSWTYNSNTEIVLNITSSGTDGDFLTVIYDNGQIFVDTDAIPLISLEYLDTNYPFDSGIGLIKLSGSATYLGRVRRSSDDAETDVGFDNGKLTLNSPVSAGGDLTTWAGSDDVFVTTLYDQGSFGSDLTQATNASQPQLMIAGALITYDSKPFLYFDGVDDYLEAGSGNSWGESNTTMTIITRNTPTAGNYIVNDRPDSGFHTFYFHGNGTAFFNSGNITLNGSVTSGAVNQKTAVALRGTSSELFIDGSSVDTDSGPSVSASNYPIRMGRFVSTNYEGYVNHFVIWKSDESANRASIEALINEIY